MKGLSFELELSKIYHKEAKPLLISSKFLRSYGAGQVDLAFYLHGKVYLLELKSSIVGLQKAKWSQEKRLIGASLIVEKITQKEVVLKYLKKDFAN